MSRCRFVVRCARASAALCRPQPGLRARASLQESGWGEASMELLFRNNLPLIVQVMLQNNGYFKDTFLVFLFNNDKC